MQFEVDTERSSISGVEFKNITLNTEEANQVYYGWHYQLSKDVFFKRHLLNSVLNLTAELPLPDRISSAVYDKVSDGVKNLHRNRNKRLDSHTRAAIDFVSEGSALVDFISSDKISQQPVDPTEQTIQETLSLGPDMAKLALQGMVYYVTNDIMLGTGITSGDSVREAHAVFTNLAAVEEVRLSYLAD